MYKNFATEILHDQTSSSTGSRKTATITYFISLIFVFVEMLGEREVRERIMWYLVKLSWQIGPTNISSGMREMISESNTFEKNLVRWIFW